MNSYLFVFLQPRNSRFRRTLRNAGVRRALSYSVDGNAEFGMDAYDESEESDVPPKLIVLSDTEDEDTEGEDNGGSTRANAGVHRVVRYSAEGNAAVPSIIILITIHIKFIFLCIYDFNCLFIFLQVRELRYRRRKRNNKGNKKRAVARDSYLQDTKVFVRDISSHREARQKKIQIDFTTRCNINADTEVPHTLSLKSCYSCSFSCMSSVSCSSKIYEKLNIVRSVLVSVHRTMSNLR